MKAKLRSANATAAKLANRTHQVVAAPSNSPASGVSAYPVSSARLSRSAELYSGGNQCRWRRSFSRRVSCCCGAELRAAHGREPGRDKHGDGATPVEATGFFLKLSLLAPFIANLISLLDA